jgi:hypothetical protein
VYILQSIHFIPATAVIIIISSSSISIIAFFGAFIAIHNGTAL